MKRSVFLIFPVVLLLLVGFLLQNPLLWAQATLGSISGKVEDTTGAVIPGAEVILVNEASGQETAKVSGESGTFSFPALTPGLYTVRVSLTGFNTFVATGIKVDTGKDYLLTAKLEVGEVTEEVVVTAGAEIVAKSDAKLSTTIGKQQIDQLPLDGRNPLNLINLNAGATFNGRTNTTINGQRTSYTSISMDGVNIQDNFIRSNATDFSPVRPTVATVGEFTITTANQGSDSGFGSSQVNFVTPRGTNQYHGEIIWFNRNSELGANEFFNNKTGTERPFLNRNQYGGTFSGPIIRDKLFFFGNIERQTIRQSVSNNDENLTVLTPDARQGIFSFVDSATGELRKVNILEAAGLELDPFIGRLLGDVPTTINNFQVGDSSEGRLLNTAGFRINQANNNDRNQYKF